MQKTVGDSGGEKVEFEGIDEDENYSAYPLEPEEKPKKKKGRGRKPKVALATSIETFREQFGSPPEMPTPDVSEATPPPERKIAVCGSAVSSVALAPYNDLSWEIWSCSPANKGQPRVDVWFELHNPEKKIQEGLYEWMEWLKEKPIVYMQKVYPGYKGAREFPLQPLMQKWGPFWWTSQLSYMLALAIEQNPKAIGLYGIDLAAASEYNQQRLGLQFFIQHIVRNTNIELSIPPESDILEPAALYGYCESSRRWRKFAARKEELQKRISILQAELAQKDAEVKHLIGAQDDMEYHLGHWANTQDFHF